ncbi:hypothetical protein [Paenibacillus glycanilyticus]|uniref:Uncharacterized protein n=1 Tax=Paenibacillus glycanilyticus TaxID=126569 RepID=A0ABQ6NU18_9BACL|nr:hypothetical protein [Paenibacillus glycanilyticus]GMK47722.1 hypothetical protein PghCCS26_48520 [Paenibacillus glycanilyticus]
MDRFLDEDRSEYTDLSTVESQRNDLSHEEFPDGSYGSSITGPTGKSGPWRMDQRSSRPYGYENRQMHEEYNRDFAGDDDYDSLPDAMDEP